MPSDAFISSASALSPLTSSKESYVIIGTHVVIGSANPDADRNFLSDVLGLRAVDAGGGYLIFGLPQAEASIHDSSQDHVLARVVPVV
jgi:hypothetical protein